MMNICPQSLKVYPSDFCVALYLKLRISYAKVLKRMVKIKAAEGETSWLSASSVAEQLDPSIFL